MSTYEFVKPWGGMVGFMTSYGLKPTPEGFEEAQEIIAHMMRRIEGRLDEASRQQHSGRPIIFRDNILP